MKFTLPILAIFAVLALFQVSSADPLPEPAADPSPHFWGGRYGGWGGGRYGGRYGGGYGRYGGGYGRYGGGGYNRRPYFGHRHYGSFW